MDDIPLAPELQTQTDPSPTHRSAGQGSATQPGCVAADAQSISNEHDLCKPSAPQKSVYAMKYNGGTAILRILPEEFIGRGASATVYGAELEQGRIRTRVAVKLHHVVDDILLRELRIWRTLSGDHILPLHGICRLGFNQIGLVAPWMANGNIMQYLHAHPDTKRLRLVRDVADGLRYLHTVANIVHGDIKGENVLVSHKGNAMLADFGLSTTVVPGENPTATDICNKMSLYFAAPELIDERLAIGNDIDPKRSKTVFSDVYAFGTLIYQVYSGSPPWYNMTFQQICLAHMNGSVPDISPLSRMDEILRAVCTACWKRAPRSRPPAVEIWSTLGLTCAYFHSKELLLRKQLKCLHERQASLELRLRVTKAVKRRFRLYGKEIVAKLVEQGYDTSAAIIRRFEWCEMILKDLNQQLELIRQQQESLVVQLEQVEE